MFGEEARWGSLHVAEPLCPVEGERSTSGAELTANRFANPAESAAPSCLAVLAPRWRAGAPANAACPPQLQSWCETRRKMLCLRWLRLPRPSGLDPRIASRSPTWDPLLLDNIAIAWRSSSELVWKKVRKFLRMVAISS